MDCMLEDGDPEGRVQRATEREMPEMDKRASDDGVGLGEAASVLVAAPPETQGSPESLPSEVAGRREPGDELPEWHEPQQGSLLLIKSIPSHGKCMAQTAGDMKTLGQPMAIQEVRMLKGLSKLISKQEDTARDRRETMSEAIAGAFESNDPGQVLMGHRLRMDVAEVYSPPRVAEMAARWSLKPGGVWTSHR